MLLLLFLLFIRRRSPLRLSHRGIPGNLSGILRLKYLKRWHLSPSLAISSEMSIVEVSQVLEVAIQLPLIFHDHLCRVLAVSAETQVLLP